MYREDLRNAYDMDREGIPVKSRSDKILEARRAFSDGSSGRNYSNYNSYNSHYIEEYLATNEKKHPFGLIRNRSQNHYINKDILKREFCPKNKTRSASSQIP